MAPTEEPDNATTGTLDVEGSDSAWEQTSRSSPLSSNSEWPMTLIEKSETSPLTSNSSTPEEQKPHSPPSLDRDCGFSTATTFDNKKNIQSRASPTYTTTPSKPTSTPRADNHGKHATQPRAYNNEENGQRFPRISRQVELMQTSYDCVVIGSGYGGSVAASRMARAGQSVCLLELGRERWPGEYPASNKDAIKELHCSGELSPPFLDGIEVASGSPTGMYHLILGKGQNAVVGNGLGGTSLMNANVFLRADSDTMALTAWPPELRQKGALDQYYDMVEDVLEPEAYPEDWPALAKLDLLKKQAEILDMKDKFYRVKQTTRFRNGPNSCGVEMSASSLSGQDCTGLNDGSKTTTLVTYLADAWNWGAEMFCECEVRHVEKVEDERGGYRVCFAWHGRQRGRFRANLHEDLMWVHARSAVFLGAGAIGTTEILLRSKALGLGLSDKVGQNMSGNGDMLAFGYDTDHVANALGHAHPSPYRPIGPTITGIIDNRSGHASALDGYVIEEGAVPQALAPFLQAMLEMLEKLPGSEAPGSESAVERVQGLLARWGSRLLGPYFREGAVEKTQVYLIMSHDSNQALLSLQNDKPVLEFLGVGSSDNVQRLNGILARATEAVGGTLVGNPFFALMKQQVTVHPIGGASMAADNTGKTGVTDHSGRLFAGNGSEVHEGLIVTDGAVIPTALGVNPLATITALAERSVHLYAESRGLTVRTESNGILDLFGQPAHVPARVLVSHDEADDENLRAASLTVERAAALRAGGFGFTEVMSGFLHCDGNLKNDDRAETYQLAYHTAQRQCESARLFLSVHAFDTRELVSGPDHRGMLTGSFACPTLPGSPFMVQRGAFHLFVADGDKAAAGTRNLTYDFDLRGTDGQTLHFHGYKVVDASVVLAPRQFWKATSTLYVTITKKDVLVAKGILHIQPADFLAEVRTLAPTGGSLLGKAASAVRFASYFIRASLGLFLAPLAPLQYPSPTCRGYVNNDTAPTRLWTDIRASDGVCSQLYMWEPLPAYVPRGADGTPGTAKNLFLVPGASVDHQIFALPTIPFNAVNYFNRAGYRVFVTVTRIGALAVAENGWTTYDARLDLRAALETIRCEYAADPVYTIAHCMGSVALSAGLLDGTIPAEWLLGLSCSQVFMNPIWNTANMIKARLGPVPMDRLYRALAGPWFSCGTSPKDAPVQRLLNQALRLLPETRRELCSSAACHRTTLVFGRCWNHANLNAATHRHIDRFFGGVHMTMLHLLMRQGSEGHVMNNRFEVLTEPDNVRVRLAGLPIFLFVGQDNAVLSPRATEKTYETLRDTFGASAAELYGRRVIPGYGHLDCWMGRHAWRDVYPVVRQEVDRVVHGPDYQFREPDAQVCRFTRMMEAGEL